MEERGLSMTDLQKLLIGSTANKLFIIKFGAPWCAPCKKIKLMAEERMDKLTSDYDPLVICMNISIEKDLDLYGSLKRKRVVQGVPTILAYQGTACEDPWYQPVDSVSGGDQKKIDAFFNRCESRAKTL